MSSEQTNLMSAGEEEREATRSTAQARLFERVLSSITDFAYTFDLAGRFTFVNKPLLDLWGLRLEEAVGRNFFDLRYPDDLAAKLQGQIEEVIRTKQRVVDETAYTSPTGVEGYYQYIFTAVIRGDGAVEAVAGSTRDITDRKGLEAEHEGLSKAVEGERSKLASIIAQAPAFICTLRGPEHVFELANELYYEVVGRRDIIGRRVRELLPEVEGQGFFELLDHVYRTGETFTGREMPLLLRRTGDDARDRRFVNFVYQAIREVDGSISGIFVHGVDVTDMVNAREAVRRSEAAFRQLADAMPQIVWTAGPDGVLDYYNQRWFEYIDLPSDAGAEATWDRYIHPEDVERVYAEWSAAVRSGKTYAVEFRVRRGDGVYRWFLVRAMVTRDAEDQTIRWYGTCTDIDDQKGLQEQNERLLTSERAARGEAETANRAKDKFLAVLSHELRTPLSPVVMTIPTMERDLEMPEKFREELAMVRRNIELEVKLIDDLLDLSRVTSGKLRLEMGPVRGHEVLRHAIHSSLSDVPGKQLHIREEMQASNDRLMADPARLQQVFWNLLRNAVKFTPAGGEIVVRTSNGEGGRLVVAVEDNGVGIPAEVLPRVFDAFEQGETRVTRQFGGLGLGLAIAKAVVEMHGGRISAASAGRNKGATFCVELETMVEEVEAEEAMAGGEATGLKESRILRVLLVEDHPDTARTMAKLLSGLGFEVKTAGSVASALQFAAAERFDVMLSDIGLPDATGYELMEEIRRRHGMKGIALSGYGMEGDVRKSREAGFVEHMVKPVNIGQLEAMLRRVIGLG